MTRPIHLDDASFVLAVLPDTGPVIIKSRIGIFGSVSPRAAVVALEKELEQVKVDRYYLLAHDHVDDEGVHTRAYLHDDGRGWVMTDERAGAEQFASREQAEAAAESLVETAGPGFKGLKVIPVTVRRRLRPTRVREAGEGEERETPEDVDPATCCSLLGLVLAIPPTERELEGRSPAELAAAAEWAGREHLAAADNPVTRLPMPVWLGPWDDASSKHAGCKHEPTLEAALDCAAVSSRRESVVGSGG